MTYGLQVISASDYVQIDENYANCGLIQSGTANTGTAITVTGGLSRTLIFVRIPYGKTITAYGAKNADQFITRPGPAGQADYAYDYRVYKRVTDLTPSNGFGLQVFDSSGLLSFDSNFGYARLAAVAALNVTGQSSSVTIPNIGSQPWILLDPLGVCAFTYLTSYVGQVWSLMATLAANGDVSIGMSPVANGPPVGSDTVITGTRSIVLAR